MKNDAGAKCLTLIDKLGDLKNNCTRASELVHCAWPDLTAHEHHVVARNVAQHVAHWDESMKRSQQAYDSHGWHVLLHWIWDHP